MALAYPPDMQEEQPHPISVPPRITHQDLKRMKDREEKREEKKTALNIHTNSTVK